MPALFTRTSRSREGTHAAPFPNVLHAAAARYPVVAPACRLTRHHVTTGAAAPGVKKAGHQLGRRRGPSLSREIFSFLTAPA
jgi:hypothetical protein